MIDISAIAANLELRDDGIWVARQQREVSYPETGNEDCFAVEEDSFWFQHRNRVLTQLVGQHSPNAVFIDIGGGNGCVAAALQSSGRETVLLEPGPAGALHARQRGLRHIIQSTLEDAGIPHAAIPSAGLFDVIEHIEHDVDFLRMIFDALQPLGTLYVTVPAYSCLWSHDDVLAGHYRRYTTKSLSALLTECGFQVIYHSYLFSCLVPPIFLLRSVPSWLGLRNSVSPAVTKQEHAGGSPFLRPMIDRWLRSERNWIQQGRRIPCGSSCLAVARKPA